MAGLQPCGHDPLAVVWNEHDRHYDCQDCLLKRPGARDCLDCVPLPLARNIPLEIAPVPLPEPDPPPEPEPEPEPPHTQPRIALGPKPGEATRAGPGAHRRNDYRKHYREQAVAREPARRWLWPDQQGLTYRWCDEDGWHEESGTVAFLTDIAMHHHNAATREALQLWGQPIGTTWWLGEALPLSHHAPVAILLTLERGLAVLMERLP